MTTSLSNRAEHNSPATRFLFERWCEKGKVLVSGDVSRRHLRVYMDAKAFYYVRIGKRGTVREYLTTARHIEGVVWEVGYREVA